MRDPAIAGRLEYLRAQIEAEQISYGEIAELEGLAEHIDPSDVVLLEWAGVPEHGRWFDVEVRDGDGLDSDVFRRYAVQAPDAKAARQIALDYAKPEFSTVVAPLYVHPDEADIDFDDVIEAEDE